MSSAAVSDGELIARVLVQDDRHAFGELVRRHQSAVRACLRKLTAGNHALADDLAQETFLLAYRNLRSFRQQAKFSTWLYRIAYNAFLAERRKIKEAALPEDGDAEERALAEGFVRQLRIKTPSVEMETGSLSGGNQQKVALARWLAIDPAVLILDEPTQGVDVGSKAEIHSLMADLAERGLAIVMISSELPELLGMSDRIAVMRGGTICGTLDRKDATQQRILAMTLGNRSQNGAV